MNTTLFKHIAIATALATISMTANATASTPADTAPAAIDNFHTIYGKNFVAGTSTYKTTFLGNIDATFKAKTTSNGSIVAGNFSRKDDQSKYAYDGIGVSPKTGSERTPGEIDIGEYINAKFTIAGTNTDAGIYIKGFSLGLLFDGPEYNDVHESVQVTASLFGGGSLSYTFTATGTQTGFWSGPGSFVSNLSPALDGRGGIWNVSNPFGNVRVSGLSFTAIPGVAAAGCSSCTNQSDFTLISVSAVPEPETYAMLLAGLGLMGFVARRKQQK